MKILGKFKFKFKTSGFWFFATILTFISAIYFVLYILFSGTVANNFILVVSVLVVSIVLMVVSHWFKGYYYQWKRKRDFENNSS